MSPNTTKSPSLDTTREMGKNASKVAIIVTLVLIAIYGVMKYKHGYSGAEKQESPTSTTRLTETASVKKIQLSTNWTTQTVSHGKRFKISIDDADFKWSLVVNSNFSEPHTLPGSTVDFGNDVKSLSFRIIPGQSVKQAVLTYTEHD